MSRMKLGFRAGGVFLFWLASAGVFGGDSGASAAGLNVKRLEDRQQRNIIFILCDDHRWDALGLLGHPFLKTPNMDRLRATAPIFDRRLSRLLFVRRAERRY